MPDSDRRTATEYVESGSSSIRLWRRYERHGIIFGSDLSQRRDDINRASNMVQYVKRYASNVPGEEELYLEYGRIKFFVDVPGIGALALIVTFQGEHHFDPDDGYHLTTIDSVEGHQAVIHVDDIIGLCGILKDLHGDPNSQIPLYSELSTARQPRMFIITKNFKGDFIHLVSDDIQ